MSEPTVCAILLTRDRPAMARQAVESFRRQTYENKRLLIVNSGSAPILDESENGTYGINEPCFVGIDAWTIGALRNHACKYASHHYAESWTQPQIFIHFDDDDLSHPHRIAEQVALLQSSGAECVGYNEVLFWRTWNAPHAMQEEPDTWDGEQAWIYSVRNPAWVIGSSLCYWRRTWQEHPFPDLPKSPDGSSEDVVWRRGVKCRGVGSIEKLADPRLLCRIHGGNTMRYEIEKYPETWRRAPQWDSYCREVVE